MTRTEHRGAEPSASGTGPHGARRAFLTSDGSRASTVTLIRCFTLIVLAIVLTGALFVPGSASAAFTRSFVRQITGPPGAPFSGPFESQPGPFGVAVDSEDNLWVSEFKSFEPPFQLDEFEHQSSTFLRTLEIEGLNPPENENHESLGLTRPTILVIDHLNGSFYTTGNVTTKGVSGLGFVELFDSSGAFLERFQSSGADGGFVDLAIDDSTEPFDLSAGSVYVSEGQEGTIGKPGAVQKLSANGETVNFVNEKGEPTKLPYVQGNKIVGAPTDLSGCAEVAIHKVGAVTVDSQGDIYVVDGECKVGVPAVLEYRPSGEFVRAIYGSETPGIGEGPRAHENGGFGGDLTGLAFDPVSDHLLLAVVAIPTPSQSRPDFEGVIDEFDAASGKFVDQISQTSTGSRLHQPSQMTVDSHGDLYVVDSSQHAVLAYSAGHFLPGVRLLEASERKLSNAVLNGSVNPGELKLSDCHFEYVTEAAFDATGFEDLASGGQAPCVPAAASLQANDAYQAVHAEVKSLVSGTTYRYRLLATSEGALGGTAASEPLAFTAPDQPRVDSSSAENISSTFADLSAQIDPLGAQTTYQFQYVDEAHYDAGAGDPYEAGVSVPVPAAGIGSGAPTGSVEVSVLEHIGGLSTGTSYHFRVVASNEIGTAYGPDQSFSTLGAAAFGLPDNRGYELLTPPSKGSASDMFAELSGPGEYKTQVEGRASQTGDRFLLQTLAAFGPFPSSLYNTYVFSRTPAGWTFNALASPSLGVQSINQALVEPADFSRVAFRDDVGPAGEAGFRQVGLVGSPGGPYTVMDESQPTSSGLSIASPESQVLGASRDMSHVLFTGAITTVSANHPLCPGVEGQDQNSTFLCEWAGGELRLVNVNSQGKLLNPCGAVPGEAAFYDLSGAAHNVISSDGSKVFFTAPDPSVKFKPLEPEVTRGCWNEEANKNTPQLYMRENGKTVQISAPEAGVSEAGKAPVQYPAMYSGASEDGSKVFFVTKTELTKDDQGIHDLELYEYDTETGSLTRVSSGESHNATANVVAVPVISDNGSVVYFMAHGKLTSDARETLETDEPSEQVNLYRYDSGTHETTYVATLFKGDRPRLSVFDWTEIPSHANPEASWYTTPDGRYLLFATSAELNGYRTAGSVCDKTEAFAIPGHCAELYRYDSRGGKPVCVSCDPSGAPAVSHALFGRSAPFASPAAGPVRAMSDDGSYVFFDSADALVPQDGNGTLDVYEWHDGHVALISSGKDSAPTFFLGTSSDGHDVFFGTHATLVPQDTDSAGDVYDARICTANDPCVKPPVGETAQCEGDACQSPPPSPIDATPGSLTFSGAGNAVSDVTSKKATTPKKKANKKCKTKRGKKAKAKSCKAAKKAKRSVRGRTVKIGRRAGA